MNYRPLHENEIQTLKSQGNIARDWEKVSVSDPFDTSSIWKTHFLGDVKLGSFKAMEENGYRFGIYNSLIKNCVLGDDVLIENVGRLMDYEIGGRAIIQNTQSITMDGPTSFRNGVEADLLNEGGGRTVKLFDRLSSQLAYMLVLFRHNPLFIEKLNERIDTYVREKIRDRGYIGSDCLIQDCTTLCNLYVHPFSKIIGADFLKNGTVVSEEKTRTSIGAGVYAHDFIVQSGSKLDSQAIIEHCFIGQSVKIEKQFSAENSLFFANCEMMHGEACSIFAGPYTVSHHKWNQSIMPMMKMNGNGIVACLVS